MSRIAARFGARDRETAVAFDDQRNTAAFGADEFVYLNGHGLNAYCKHK
ncbi:MAG: hypothetical protein IPG44_17410 [Anaerolineales bacterium]|nr:hypothetical protein [Anaerolineales bacterium]